MSFWDVFKKTAYFRLSWKIQDELISSAEQIKRSNELRSIQENREDIVDKVYNNSFTRKRKRP